MALGKTFGDLVGKTGGRAFDAIFGTPPHELHRRGAVDTSVSAAYAVDSAGLEARVLAVIAAAGEAGITQDGILDAMPDVGYPSVTARLPALIRKGLVVDTGIRRPGRSGRPQRVVRATGAA